MRAPMKLALAIACSLPGLVLAGHDAPAPARFQASYGGSVVAPVKQGPRLYVPAGSTITTWNYRNPAFPFVAGDTSREPLDGVITALVRYGDHLYASWRKDSTSGVAIYALAMPDHPTLVDRGDHPEGIVFGNISSLAVHGDRLYVFDAGHGLVVQSLADPLHPRVIGTGPDAPVDVAAVADGRLIGTGRNFLDQTVLSVFDVDRPRAPTLITSQLLDGFDNFRMKFDWPRAAGFGLAVNSYVLSPAGGAPKLVGSADPGEAIFNGFVSGDTGYGLGQSGLSVWNLRAPVQRIGQVDFANAFASSATYVQDRQAWVLTASDELAAFDLTHRAAPRLQSSVNLAGGADARDASEVDGRLVMLQDMYGLSTARANDLQPLGRFDAELPKDGASRDFEAMYVDGRRAYLAAWGFGLITVDLNDPAYPRELGRLELPLRSTIAGRGRYLYLGQVTNGGSLTVVDVADPAQPRALAYMPLEAGAQRFQIAGHYLYAAIGDGPGIAGTGLRVIDIRRPEKPVVVGAYQDGCGNAFDVALGGDGRTAYLRCTDGLHVLDISRPDQPARIGFYGTGSESFMPMVVDGQRAFLTNHGGLDELDLRNPRKPILIAHHTLPAPAKNLRVMPDRRLFAFTGIGGIAVFDLAGTRGVSKATTAMNGATH